MSSTVQGNRSLPRGLGRDPLDRGCDDPSPRESVTEGCAPSGDFSLPARCRRRNARQGLAEAPIVDLGDGLTAAAAAQTR